MLLVLKCGIPGAGKLASGALMSGSYSLLEEGTAFAKGNRDPGAFSEVLDNLVGLK